jgi:hypothetical protein
MQDKETHAHGLVPDELDFLDSVLAKSEGLEQVRAALVARRAQLVATRDQWRRRSVRLSQCPTLRQACAQNVLPMLRPLFQERAQYVYIVNHARWGGIVKFGITHDLRARFSSYFNHNPEDGVIEFVIACTDGRAVEDHIKLHVGPHLIDETRLEWVRMRPEPLARLILSWVTKHEALSADCRSPVYSLRAHDCAVECLPTLPRLPHRPKHCALVDELRRKCEAAVQTAVSAPPVVVDEHKLHIDALWCLPFVMPRQASVAHPSPASPEACNVIKCGNEAPPCHMPDADDAERKAADTPGDQGRPLKRRESAENDDDDMATAEDTQRLNRSQHDDDIAFKQRRHRTCVPAPTVLADFTVACRATVRAVRRPARQT